MTRAQPGRGLGALSRWSVALLLTATLNAHAAPSPRKVTFESAGAKRSYYLFIPESLAADQPAPVMLMLHGSYGSGIDLVGKWTDIATRDGVILVGPNSLDDTFWQLRPDGPEFIRDVIDAVARQHPIDRRRLYLFGHSGGAVHALTLGMLESEYFAAVAIYAGAWRENNAYQALTAARRKIPVLLMVGDKDQFFPMKTVQRTESAIRDAGHPVSLTVFKRHGHSYEDLAPIINRTTWEFLKVIELDVTPHFQSYS
ncbi:MAG TPA: dienelactone hydrolase family protein [Steroidobacteraceae bacterium]|jgi:poly(3-hydroxybutyrate) depolymerase